jgi:adenylate kinase
MEEAIEDGQKRLLITCKIPELNTDFDVYRVGTLLELVRDLTVSLAADGKIVKVCVQQPLGQGVFQGTPLSLNGVMRIMKQMDWGPAGDFIKFGNISASEVPDADTFILISPQNINGQSIVPFLREMSEAAAAADKPIVLINPMLTDVPSSDGVMGVRGRGDRQDFVLTFSPCYYFRLLYKSSSMYPIMGALRHAYNGTWEVYKRFEPAPRAEEFRVIGTFDGGEPNPTQITACFKTSPPINSSAT